MEKNCEQEQVYKEKMKSIKDAIFTCQEDLSNLQSHNLVLKEQNKEL